MSVYEEKARTKWKPVGVLRLRRCIVRSCRSLFPSAGPDERRCPRCAKRIDDARARAFAPNPEAEIKELLEEWFDEEMIERNKREYEHDSERRILRQKGKGLRS